MKSFCRCLLLLCLAGLARAETYRDWMGPEGGLEFVPWPANVVASGLRLNGKSVPRAPALGLLGNLTPPQLLPDRYPLTIDILYDRIPVDRSALQPDQDAKGWDRFIGRVDPRTPIHPVAHQRRVRVAWEDRGRALPVWAERLDALNMMAYAGIPVTVRAEARDRSGKVVARRWVAECYAVTPWFGGAAAVTMEDDEGDRWFTEAGMSSLERVDRLPPDSMAFDGVRAAWVGASALADPALSPGFFRRLLLSGVTLVARAPVAEGLSRRAGAPLLSPVLGAGLMSSAQLGRSSEERLLLQQHPGNLPPVANPEAGAMLDHAPLGADRSKGLQRFAMVHLGFFLLVEILVLVGGFSILRAERRLALWLIVPGVSVLFSVGGWVVAPVLLNLRPAAEALEVQYSREGWEESLVETHLGHLAFSGDRFGWALDPGNRRMGVGQMDGGPGLMLSAARGLRTWEEDGPEAFRWRESIRRGRITRRTFRRWEGSKSPLAVEGGRLALSEDFDRLWFWDGAEWRDAGPRRAGETLPVGDAGASPERPRGASRSLFGSFGLWAGLPGRVRAAANPEILAWPGFAGRGLLIGLQKGRGRAAASTARAFFDEETPVQDFRKARVRVHEFALP